MFIEFDPCAAYNISTKSQWLGNDWTHHTQLDQIPVSERKFLELVDEANFRGEELSGAIEIDFQQ